MEALFVCHGLAKGCELEVMQNLVGARVQNKVVGTDAALANVGVLQLIPRLDSGGAERATLEIARALNAAGARAYVATEGGRLVSELRVQGTNTIKLPLASKNPAVMLANAWRLRDVIERENIALVHARSRAPAWSGLLAARLSGRRFVTTFHGLYRGKSPLKRWYNGVMARGDVVIANSDYTAGHVRLLYPHSKSRLVTIPRGVDLDLFDPAHGAGERASALRAVWSLLPDERLVLVPGRITQWKGQHLAIEALAALRQRRPTLKAVAVLVGDTQSTHYRDQLRAQAFAAGLGERVRIVGFCSDMPAAYAAADVVVQASIEPEGFGRVAAEAQAMEAVVIASDLGAAAETIVTGNEATGFRIRPNDAAALADALDEALALEPAAREALGRRASAHVRARFTLQRMCADTLGVYRSLLAGGGDGH